MKFLNFIWICTNRNLSYPETEVENSPTVIDDPDEASTIHIEVEAPGAGGTRARPSEMQEAPEPDRKMQEAPERDRKMQDAPDHDRKMQEAPEHDRKMQMTPEYTVSEKHDWISYKSTWSHHQLTWEEWQQRYDRCLTPASAKHEKTLTKKRFLKKILLQQTKRSLMVMRHAQVKQVQKTAGSCNYFAMSVQSSEEEVVRSIH